MNSRCVYRSQVLEYLNLENDAMNTMLVYLANDAMNLLDEYTCNLLELIVSNVGLALISVFTL
jgi:hypothetical protein